MVDALDDGYRHDSAGAVDVDRKVRGQRDICSAYGSTDVERR